LLYRGRNLHPALKHISHTLSSYFCAMPKSDRLLGTRIAQTLGNEGTHWRTGTGGKSALGPELRAFLAVDVNQLGTGVEFAPLRIGAVI
ncbi:MAG: hypothetical protein M3495_07000, partial [Pseudomonadota bacterium]|nr:hypothetical protein [Pseudomonadota bacterium]